jgi:5-methylcytosine-specific restriction endonuclease McrA
MRGGDNRGENLQLLCPECNNLKRGKHPDVFKKELAEGKIKRTPKNVPRHLEEDITSAIILQDNSLESQEN